MQVQKLTAQDVPSVVDVLCESFFDYPVMRFVLGSSGSDYEAGIRQLVHFFVMARVFREEPMVGIAEGDTLQAAALMSRPGPEPAPHELSALRDQVWDSLGPAAEARYEAFATACAPFDVDVPHLHLNMIGVRRTLQGRGLSRTLLDYVHNLSAADPSSTGVSLTTEDSKNVSLYRHFGYKVVGTASVSPGVNTWGFFRADP